MPLVLLLPYGKTENLIVVAVVVTVVAECFHRREKTQHRRSAHERKMSEKHASAATEICALPASPLFALFHSLCYCVYGKSFSSLCIFKSLNYIT